MKKSRFFFSAVVSLLLTLSMLTGCSSQPALEDEHKVRVDNLQSEELSGGEEAEEAEETDTEQVIPGLYANEAADVSELKIALLRMDSRMPWEVTDPWTAKVLMLVCEPLFKLDEEGRLQGCLAESYSCVQAGNYLEIKLRKNVKFHDGSLLDSGDVVYTVNSLLKSENYYSGMVAPIVKAEKVNSSTLRLFFADAGMMNLEGLSFPIVPMNSKSGALPVGTGPYRVYETITDREIVLGVNQEYSEGLPKIQTVRIYQVPEASLIFDCFECGRTNLYSSDILEWGRYLNNTDKMVFSFDTYEAIYLAFDMTRPVMSVFSNRQKLALATDAEACLKEIYYGRGMVTETLIRPGTWYHEEPTLVYGYDLSMSLAMECEGEAVVTLLYDETDEILKQAASLLKSQWEEAGFAVVLTTNEKAAYDVRLLRENVFLKEAMEMAGLSLQDLAAAKEENVKQAAKRADDAMSRELSCYGLFFLQGGVITGAGIHGEMDPQQGYELDGIEELIMSGE